MIDSDIIMSIGTLLDKYNFSVPDYQRGYEWEVTNVDEFHKDLTQARDANQSRFVGSLILKRSTPHAKSVELVDGQQRVTTVFIYLCILRDLLDTLDVKELPLSGLSKVAKNPSKTVEDLILTNNKDNYRLQPNDFIAELFLDCVAPPPMLRKPMPKKHKNYSKDFRKAYAEIRKVLTDEVNQIPDGPDSQLQKLALLDRYVKALTENLQVLAIYTDQDAEALEIFMTMNTKGVSLAASDIVKSLIFKSALMGSRDADKPEMSAHLLTRWRQLVENLEGANLDQVFRHYFLGKTKVTFTVKGLIPRTQTEIERPPLNPDQNAVTLLNDLISTSTHYRAILDAAISNCDTESDAINESILCLNKINSSFRILILPLLFPEPKFDKFRCRQIVDLVERATLSWQIAGKNAQQLEDQFHEIAWDLNESRTDSDHVIATLTDLIPDLEQIRTELAAPITDSTVSRVLLFRLHQFLGDVDRLIPYDTDKTDVEHVAPRVSTPDWRDALDCDESEDGIEKYSDLVELIGNKTLLEQTINNSLRQRSFAEKKAGFVVPRRKKDLVYLGFSKSQIEMTRQLAKCDQWGAPEIYFRTEWIVDCFSKIFLKERRLDDLVDFSTWRLQAAEQD